MTRARSFARTYLPLILGVVALLSAPVVMTAIDKHRQATSSEKTLSLRILPKQTAHVWTLLHRGEAMRLMWWSKGGPLRYGYEQERGHGAPPAQDLGTARSRADRYVAGHTSFFDFRWKNENSRPVALEIRASGATEYLKQGTIAVTGADVPDPAQTPRERNVP